jgi:hypothetical protein
VVHLSLVRCTALGGVIEETPEPFLTDVYDLHEPLESLCAPSLGLALLGDSAHAITPHMAKGESVAPCVIRLIRPCIPISSLRACRR